MNKQIKNYLFLAIIASVIIALDQWSKVWIRTNMALGEIWSPVDSLAPFVRIVHWYNTGVAFGMFQGMGNIFTILAIIVAVAIIYFYPQVPEGDWALRIAMSMQLGGAVGNLIDRVLNNGQVTDFIAIGTFPVFNIADASISTGIGVLILGVWLQDRKKKKEETMQVSSLTNNHTPPAEQSVP